MFKWGMEKINWCKCFHYHVFKLNECLYIKPSSISHKHGKYFNSHMHMHCLFWKFVWIKKLLVLKNYLYSKLTWIIF
jgi:hypothetical protein